MPNYDRIPTGREAHSGISAATSGRYQHSSPQHFISTFRLECNAIYFYFLPTFKSQILDCHLTYLSRDNNIYKKIPIFI